MTTTNTATTAPMTEREKSAHMEGFFKGRGAVRAVKVLPMSLNTAGERAAFKRGLAAGKAVSK